MEKTKVVPIVENKDVILQIYPDFYDFNVDGVYYTVETLKNNFVVNEIHLDAIDTVLRTFKTLCDMSPTFDKDSLLSLIEIESWITELGSTSDLSKEYLDDEQINYFNLIEYYGNELLKEANLFGDFVVTYDKDRMFYLGNTVFICSKGEYIEFLNKTIFDYNDGNLRCQLFSEFVKKEDLTVDDFYCMYPNTFNQNLDNKDNIVYADMVFVK